METVVAFILAYVDYDYVLQWCASDRSKWWDTKTNRKQVKLSHLITKPTKWLCAQRRLSSAWASDLSWNFSHLVLGLAHDSGCPVRFFFWKLKKIIRIFHGCEVRIEKFIRVMPNSDPEGRFITTELRDVLYICTTSVLKPHFYSFFIYPTGRIRICKIWFVSSNGENRGKHCLVSKKICSSPSRPILCCRYWSPLTGFYLVVF